MILSASSLFVCLDFLERHPGLLLVLVGVAGEILCDWKDMEGRLARAKKFSAVLLVMGLMIEFWEAAKSDSELASTKERTANAEKEAKNAGVLVEKIGTTNALLVSTNLWLAKEVLELAQQLKDTSKTAIETRDFVNETNTTARINEAHNIVTDAQKVAADISTIVASQDFKNLAQLKPKPLKERIRDCLNKISPTFLPEFDKRGDSWEWNGYFPQSRLEELEDLSKEPGGWKYIEIQRTGSGGMGTAGVTLEAKLHFFQFLLDKPN